MNTNHLTDGPHQVLAAARAKNAAPATGAVGGSVLVPRELVERAVEESNDFASLMCGNGAVRHINLRDALQAILDAEPVRVVIPSVVVEAVGGNCYSSVEIGKPGDEWRLGYFTKESDPQYFWGDSAQEAIFAMAAALTSQAKPSAVDWVGADDDHAAESDLAERTIAACHG